MGLPKAPHPRLGTPQTPANTISVVLILFTHRNGLKKMDAEWTDETEGIARRRTIGTPSGDRCSLCAIFEDQ